MTLAEWWQLKQKKKNEHGEESVSTSYYFDCCILPIWEKGGPLGAHNPPHLDALGYISRPV